jgi:ADP-heptose:LPS heptosyltransferase
VVDSASIRYAFHEDRVTLAKRLERRGKKLLLRWLRYRLARGEPDREREPEGVLERDLPDRLGRVRRILVVRKHDQIGDLILSTPALAALRRAFPQSVVSVVVRDYAKEVLYNNPHVDRLLVYPERWYGWPPSRWLDFWRELRRERFDLAIVLNTVSHSVSSDIVACLARAPLRLGSDHLPLLETGDIFAYNLVARRDPAPKHEVERSLDIIRRLGIEIEGEKPRIYLSDGERERGHQLLASIGVVCTGNQGERARSLVGIHAGPRDVRRRWPREELAGLAKRLHEQRAVYIIIIWGPGEESLRDRMARAVGESAAVLPRTSMRELAAVLSHLDLCICGDTGVFHVAGAVGCPTLSYYSATDPRQWGPYLGDRRESLARDRAAGF